MKDWKSIINAILFLLVGLLSIRLFSIFASSQLQKDIIDLFIFEEYQTAIVFDFVKDIFLMVGNELLLVLFCAVLMKVYDIKNKQIIVFLCLSICIFIVSFVFSNSFMPYLLDFLSKKITSEDLQIQIECRAIQTFIFREQMYIWVILNILILPIYYSSIGLLKALSLKNYLFLFFFLFSIAVIISPPDPLSCTINSLALIILLLIGFLISRLFRRNVSEFSKDTVDCYFIICGVVSIALLYMGKL